VRLTGPPGAHHFEVRTVDATASPISRLQPLGLGLVGMDKVMELEIEGTEEPAMDLSAEERERRGIVGRLERTLSGARNVGRRAERSNHQRHSWAGICSEILGGERGV
jgi:hypothetical protein